MTKEEIIALKLRVEAFCPKPASADQIHLHVLKALDALEEAHREIERLKKQNGELARCLLPVWMDMCQEELAGRRIPDDEVVLHFMGCGASDQVTAREIRSALGESTT